MPLLASLSAIAIVTWVYVRWLHVSNPAIVSITFLLIVLVVATTSRLRVAVTTSFAAMLSFNYFFLPPVGTWSIADAQNWVALVALLVVSLVASQLSARVRARTEEAVVARHEMTRLFDLSRDVLVMSGGRHARAALARSVAHRFDLDFVAVAQPHGADWDLDASGPRPLTLEPAELTRVFDAARSSLEFDAHTRTYAGHHAIERGGRTIRLIPLRTGTTPVGLLAVSGRTVEPGTLDTLAGLVAIAIERTRFVDELKTAEMTRASEELKAALLASLAHDLRTPLAAIRIAASNMRASTLSAEERDQQGQLVLDEVERLTRLFDSILDMARLDAGAVVADRRWVHPSEIVDAARDQVAQTLAGHQLLVEVDRDEPVCLDARLTASALAHLLENAAQYAPPGTAIDVRSQTTDRGLLISVRDRGPGIAAADLPHLFERFYRGDAARSRTSGTGMGLSIARGLLAVTGGAIWGENDPGGGARFTIDVPAAQRAAAAALTDP